jgi:lysozyme family protein
VNSRNFDYCVKRVLEEEGGEVDHPNDPGGHTNLGVTQGTLNSARLLMPELPEKVSALTRADAVRIYRALYWDTVRGDELPLGLALMVFDCAVNQGPSKAVAFLQHGVGVRADGAFGKITAAAVRKHEAGAKLREAIREVAARRMYHYMTLDHLQGTFGLGWSRRLMRALDMALSAPVAE